MDRRSGVRLAAALPLAALVLLTAIPASAAGPYRNVIVMIPDGCDTNVQTLARWYKGAPLAVDGMMAGSVATYMHDSVITDSAAAGTALASGYKTSDGFVGVGPRLEGTLSTLSAPSEALRYAPIATVLEGAKQLGLGTGLIATSRISHATPAAYAAHIHDRGLDNVIMEHLVYNDVDVVLGGGERHLLPSSAGGRRSDGENLRRVLTDRGYQYVNARWGLSTLTSGRAWGMFASSHMEAELDRTEFAPSQPSIAEMTSKAIELLSADHPEGFFLMVEGSQVDWAGHANDPIYMVTDFLAFDEAVQVAKDFADQDGETLIVIAPDHNTGGLTIGNHLTDWSYTAVSVEDVVAPLSGMRLTAYGVARKIGSDTSVANIQAQVSEWWGIDLTADDVAAILDYEAAGLSLDYALSRVVSERYTVIGWTTHGHNGGDVPLYTFGPNRPVGHFDNTELAFMVADAFGFDLDVMSDLLFVEVTEAMPDGVLDMSDPENPVFGTAACRLPVDKDVLHYAPLGIDFRLPGLVVHAPETGKVYASYVAVALAQALEANPPGVYASKGTTTVEETLELLGLDRDALARRGAVQTR